MPSRRLVDGRSSRGYVPLEQEVFRLGLSAEALGLLAQLRNESAVNEQDGVLDAATAAAAAAYCKLSPTRLRRALSELKAVGWVLLPPGGGVGDPNYGAWSKTHAERDREREGWRERQRAVRAGETEGQMSLDVTRDMPVTPDDVTPPSREMSRTPAPPPHTPPLHPRAEAEAEAETGPTGLRPSGPPLVANAPRGAHPPSTDSSSSGADDGADRLCELMCELVAQRAKAPAITPTWRREARLLLDRDRRPYQEAEALMRWAAEDRFWRRNVLSIPKFRNHYDRLLMEARDQPVPNGTRLSGHGRRQAARDARALERLGAASEAPL